MTPGFVKFPHTPHLAWLSSGLVRGDKVLDIAERHKLLLGEVVVEEKVDGANLGISVVDGQIFVQNRSGFIRNQAHPQFQPLWAWLAKHQSLIHDYLGTNLILFGEWCFLRHTIEYTSLPDWFLTFDVYDRAAKRFWSTQLRDGLVAAMKISRMPELGRGHFGVHELVRMLHTSKSAVGGHAVEGLYVRRNEGGWLARRAKLVQAGFIQSVDEHWMSRTLERNRLRA